MRNRTDLSARVQYIALRTVMFALRMFPLELNLQTARLVGRIWWRLDRRHRQLARDHLQAAYAGQLPDKRLNEISRRCFEHWTMYAVEFLTGFDCLSEWSWPQYIILRDLRELFRILLDKRGAILLTGHYGNFELTAYMLAAIGFDVTAVMRPLDNAFLNDYVVRTRTRRGLRLLDKFGVTTDAENILRRGGALGFVADQDAGRKGIFVNFFRRPASTYKSIGLLAMACDVPIVIGFARRLGSCFRYEVGVQRIIRPEEWKDRPDPLHWITQEYSAAIEAAAREHPEQYLWIHRRWKTAPRSRSRPAISAAPS